MALHIMVVEDEPAIRQELCQLLSNALYRMRNPVKASRKRTQQ